MSWKISRYRAGDLIEVRSPEEIFATLDEQGCTDALPFMPEMLQYCGKQFRVAAVAHKSCDMIGKLGTSRRHDTTVHLEGLRCDGSAHGGCEAECNLYWKDVWLKPVEGDAAKPGPIEQRAAVCNEQRLREGTRYEKRAGEDEQRYRCQATEMFNATRVLPSWDLRQYVFDVTTRNQTFASVVRGLILAFLRRTLPRLPVGYRAFKSFNDFVHKRFTGRPAPEFTGLVPTGVQTPVVIKNLQPGEYVRVLPVAEIAQTLDEYRKNRGLQFDHEEMAPYCGKVVRVRRRVTRLVDERTGRMLQMKQPCIMLDGVVCRSQFALGRLNCPRAIPSFWRENWLERVAQDVPAGGSAVADECHQQR